MKWTSAGTKPTIYAEVRMPVQISATLAYDGEADVLNYALRNTTERRLNLRVPHPDEDLRIRRIDRGGERHCWRFFGLRVPEEVVLPPDGSWSGELELLQNIMPDGAGPHEVTFRYHVKRWSVPVSPSSRRLLDGMDDVEAVAAPVTVDVPEALVEEWRRILDENRARRNAWGRRPNP